MEEYKDEEFIKLALQYHYVTQSDVDSCLPIQVEMAGRTGIGEILRQHRYINDQQYNVITTLLKYKTNPVYKKESQVKQLAKSKDRQFAEASLRSRLITEAQLIECAELQKALEKDGESRSLAYVMMRKGYLTESDIAFIEEGGTPVTLKYTREESMELLDKLPVHLIGKKKTSEQFPVLTVLQGEDVGKVYLLSKNEVTIGRVKGADIRLNDSYVSRIHCKIVYDNDNGVWEIIDMMSTHGVSVNAHKISQRQILCFGDRIRLGETVLEFAL